MPTPPRGYEDDLNEISLAHHPERTPSRAGEDFVGKVAGKCFPVRPSLLEFVPEDARLPWRLLYLIKLSTIHPGEILPDFQKKFQRTTVLFYRWMCKLRTQVLPE